MPLFARIPCYLEGFEDYGLFVGCILAIKGGTNNQVRKSAEFLREVQREFECFRENYEYSHENVQKYFSRYFLSLNKSLISRIFSIFT